MTERPYVRWVVLSLVLLTFVPGLLYYEQLPEQVPIHWGARGEPDMFGPKFVAVALAPVVGLAFFVFTYVVGSQRARRRGGTATRILVPFILLAAQIWLVWSALQ